MAFLNESVGVCKGVCFTNQTDVYVRFQRKPILNIIVNLCCVNLIKNVKSRLLECILWMMLAISFALISCVAFAQGCVHSRTQMIQQ